MRGAVGLYQTSVGKKIVMALSGLVLVLFVVGHMIGNLKVFFGQEAFDHYAHGLRTLGDPLFAPGQFLWIVRIALLAAVGIHMLSAFLTWRQSSTARDVGYRKSHSLSFSYASRTMRWGGVIIAAFVVYHLLHLTVGSVHPEFTASPYANVHVAFSNPLVSAGYVGVMVLLAFHLYHGVWSATQTLDLDTARFKPVWRPLAGVVTAIVFLGFVAVPVSVLTGLVDRPSAVVAVETVPGHDATMPIPSSDAGPDSSTDAGSQH